MITRTALNNPGDYALIENLHLKYDRVVYHTVCDNSKDYRFGFNGMEKDNEAKGLGNSLDFGARIYDSRLGRWLSRDPREADFPYQSGYVGIDNDPINRIDPTGKSGEAVIDRENKTVTIYSTIIAYGNSATKSLAKQSAQDIDDRWNAAHATIMIDGESYTVQFKTTSKVVSERRAKRMMAKNGNNVRNNFVRYMPASDLVVKPGAKKSSFMLGLGGNSGTFLVEDIGGGQTTVAHEWGHGLGWYDPHQSSFSGSARGAHDLIGNFIPERVESFLIEYSIPGDNKGAYHGYESFKFEAMCYPGIMTPRGVSNAHWRGLAPLSSEWLKSDGTIDPNKRIVRQRDIDLLHIDVGQLSKNGRTNVGNTNNIFIKRDGTR